MKRLMAIGAAAVVTAGASAQNAVQWRVEDGGNGHWYVIVVEPHGLTWGAARDQATAAGGYLACLETPNERSFVFARFSRLAVPTAWIVQMSPYAPMFGPWLGAWQDVGSVEPAGGWRWLTGGLFDPTLPPNCCNDVCEGSSNEDRLQLYSPDGADVATWNDIPNVVTCGNQPISYLIEFAADCNSDGVVDFGQILAGELPDANHNNIPDCCEAGPPCDCPGDTNNDGAVNGIDLATILTRWAQPAAKFPSADCNRDGVIDGSDLAIVLGSWGVCP